MNLLIQNARGAFLNIFEAKAFGGDPKAKADFNGLFIITPQHPAHKQLEKAFAEVAKEKWGPKSEGILKLLKQTDKTCLHNGDVKSSWDGFEGNFYISARSAVRPTVLNRDRSPITKEDGKAYSGAYYNVSIEIWAQDNKFGKRLNATLRGLQFVADGDAFSGGAAPADADEFADLSVSDSELENV